MNISFFIFYKNDSMHEYETRDVISLELLAVLSPFLKEQNICVDSVPCVV